MPKDPPVQPRYPSNDRQVVLWKAGGLVYCGPCDRIHCPSERCLTEEERPEAGRWEVWSRPGGGLFMTSDTLIEYAKLDWVLEGHDDG